MKRKKKFLKNCNNNDNNNNNCNNNNNNNNNFIDREISEINTKISSVKLKNKQLNINGLRVVNYGKSLIFQLRINPSLSNFLHQQAFQALRLS